MSTPETSSKFRHQRVDDQSAGQRIDNFLIRHCPGVPRSHLYRLIRQGQVRVDGKRIKQTRKLTAGELVKLPAVSESAGITKVPGELLKALAHAVLVECEDFLIVNKPPGIAVHKGSGLAFGLIDALQQHYDEPSLELSHRLDRATSGCLLIGRNRLVNKQLQQLFRDRAVDKRYQALVDGRWPDAVDRITVPLLSNQSHAGERRVMVDKRGQAADTRFRIAGYGQSATLLDIQLETGRTHQIRVHTRHAGHPVIGDERYGHNKANQQFRRLGLKRLFLHASSLTFDWQGRRIHASAPTDSAWQRALESLSINTDEKMLRSD